MFNSRASTPLLYVPMLVTANIISSERIYYEFIKIKKPVKIIIGNVQTANIHMRAFLHIPLKDTVPVTGAERLKVSATLTGHLHANAHIRRKTITIYIDVTETPRGAVIITPATLLKVTIRQPEELNHRMNVIYFTTKSDPVDKNI